MKKLLSIKYSNGAFNTATFILRITLGLLMITHGYDKLMHLSGNHDKFVNFLGLGTNVSYYLTTFAEFFCSLLLILGLFTRFAAIPLAINMAVAVWVAHNKDVFGDGEHAALYLGGYIVVLLLGPGKFSVDGMIGK
jgi:putative oxidoreductase